jgi:hypothetical protein
MKTVELDGNSSDWSQIKTDSQRTIQYQGSLDVSMSMSIQQDASYVYLLLEKPNGDTWKDEETIYVGFDTVFADASRNNGIFPQGIQSEYVSSLTG